MMTKGQFFTFKSDLKKGMRIARLYKTHRKAYWNEGYATQGEQNEAKAKDWEEIKSLMKTIALREPDKVWDITLNKWVDDANKTRPVIVLGDDPRHHWAYYCAKHRLDETQSIEYVKNELNKMKQIPFAGDAKYIYVNGVKTILDKYEKIVCPDR